MKKKKIYYTSQTRLALKNFPFSLPLVHKEFIYAISYIKEAAAKAHMQNKDLSNKIAKAIIRACKEVSQGQFDDQFLLPGLQGGAGTSIHMNVNEVVATRATEILVKNGTYEKVHPNDHVNKSQSTNDVCPSAMKIACLKLIDNLLKTLDDAIIVFERKAAEFNHVVKLGRTHLQDAVPTNLGEEFSSYTQTIKRGKTRIEKIIPYFYELNLGGTAIGNSINASLEYKKNVYKNLRRITKLPLRTATNLMSQTSSQTDFLMLSQAIVSLLVDFSKIANDIRLLAGGPNGGLGEIKLKELQPGSSIMPGKINPVLAESVNQAYFLISGNNVAIEHAVQAAQLELGAMFPVIADRLITSLKLSDDVINIFIHECIAFVSANEDRCKEYLESSTAYATLLTPKLGYEQVSKMVKEAKHNNKLFQQALAKQID